MAAGLRDTASGFFGGVCCVYVGQPFDTLKLRMQAGMSERGLRGTLAGMVRREGVRALWKGVTPALASSTCENSVLFFANGVFQRLLFGGGQGQEPTVGQLAMCGALSGVFSATAITPFEVTKVNLQRLITPTATPPPSSPSPPVSTPLSTAAGTSPQPAAGSISASSTPATKTTKTSSSTARPGPISVARSVVAADGWQGLFRGVVPTLARDVPFCFFFFGTYAGATQAFRALRRRRGADEELGALEVLLAGGCAGSVAWGVMFPCDAVKSLAQLQPAGSGPQVLASVRASGVRALYRGWSAAVLRAFPANAALFLGQSAAHKAFGVITRPEDEHVLA